MKTRFRIAEIAVDDDGTYHVAWLGMHADQGGMNYRWGHLGIHGLDGIGNLLEGFLKPTEQVTLDRVKAKQAEIDQEKETAPVKTDGV